jgi:hypothetical protein
VKMRAVQRRRAFAASVRRQQDHRMKQATLVMALVLVGCAIDGHDPDDPDGDLVGAVPTHEQDNCPSGGGGGGSGGGGEADPHPIPAPRDCTEEASRELCLDCCDWNVDKVWASVAAGSRTGASGNGAGRTPSSGGLLVIARAR